MVLVQLGHVKVDDAFARFTEEELIRAYYYFSEKTIKLTRESQEKNNMGFLNVVFIVDLDGMTLFSHMSKKGLDFFKVSLNLYIKIGFIRRIIFQWL